MRVTSEQTLDDFQQCPSDFLRAGLEDARGERAEERGFLSADEDELQVGGHVHLMAEDGSHHRRHLDKSVLPDTV